MAIVGRISLYDGLHLGSLKAIRKTAIPRSGQTISGYGRKMPTHRMIMLKGERHWRRVYCACFANAGTCYVTIGNDWLVIED